MPCHAPVLLWQCRVLRKSPRGSQKYLNCYSNSLTDHLFCSVLLPLVTLIGMDRCEEDGMLLITISVELRIVAGRSRKRAGSPQAVSWRPCCAMALRRTAWSEHGMTGVNQTWPHCVNQMGKTHSKPLAAWHGHGMLCVISAFSHQDSFDDTVFDLGFCSWKLQHRMKDHIVEHFFPHRSYLKYLIAWLFLSFNNEYDVG